MQAGKACDAYGLLPGHSVEQCDAEQAYIQSKLEGPTPTWVRIPRERWPAEWAEMRDPVCPLILALYGHPDSGGYWERHCDKNLRLAGFTPVDDWPSCYFRADTGLFLVVYVDDFKLAGPSQHLKAGWELIRAHIKTETPTPVGKYLGCDHTIVHIAPQGTASEVWDLLSPPPAVDNTPTRLAPRGGVP